MKSVPKPAEWHDVANAPKSSLESMEGCISAVGKWLATSFVVFLYGFSIYAFCAAFWFRKPGEWPVLWPSVFIFAFASILLAKDLSHLFPEPIYKTNDAAFLLGSIVVLALTGFILGETAFWVTFVLWLLLAKI